MTTVECFYWMLGNKAEGSCSCMKIFLVTRIHTPVTCLNEFPLKPDADKSYVHLICFFVSCRRVLTSRSKSWVTILIMLSLTNKMSLIDHRHKKKTTKTF